MADSPNTGVREGMYDIPLGFHFKVEFSAGPNGDDLGIGKDSFDVRFQEVTGLTAELGTENLEEGGENRFAHRLPTRAKFNNLTLKRGMLIDTKLRKWFEDAIYQFDFQPLTVMVMLLNDGGDVVSSWEFKSVWPVKWSISDLKATENALVIETVELAYQYFERKK